jgi:preprotein translocase subunit SecF
LAVFFLGYKGLNRGVDFTGGTIMEVAYAQSADVPKIRSAIEEDLGFRDVSVQNFGTSQSVLVRLPEKIKAPEGSDRVLTEIVMDVLQKQDASAQLQRVEFVGAQVGKELYESGIYALIAVSLGIVFYLWMRFEWKFGVAAILANMHDVVIILGFFAFFQWDFSLTVLAGVLAVLGYSVNESVVIFDRIRENFRKMRKAGTVEVIDNSITANISRTIITHGSTQLAVLAMLFLGGETLHYFALALTIGILFSIYSSVFVAAAIIMWLGVSREDLMPAKKEGALDSMP